MCGEIHIFTNKYYIPIAIFNITIPCDFKSKAFFHEKNI
jgi:hypothetical protein